MLLWQDVCKTRIRMLIQEIFIFYWITFLQSSESYLDAYLLVGLCGSICCWANANKKPEVSRPLTWVFVAVSACFAAAVTLANYGLFLSADAPWDAGPVFRRGLEILTASGVLLGGFFAVLELLCFLCPKAQAFTWKGQSLLLRPGAVFALAMGAAAMLDLIALFRCMYPGALTFDSVHQINQILTGEYTNHHPFYQTIILRLFITIGLRLFGSMNAAVATFSVFQILFMTACFGYVTVTLYQMRVPRVVLVLCWLWYTLMPFHMIYSFTLWKDVMFAGTTVVFTVAAFRVLAGIGRNAWHNYLLMLLGGAGICLWRSNGWFAFFVTTFCFALLFFRSRKRLCLALVAVLAVTLVMTQAVLYALQIEQPEPVESLSIPAQQIARVIADGGRVTDEQRTLLEQVVDVEKIPETYTDYIADPIKNLISASGNEAYLSEHKGEFLRLYLEIGLANPGAYIKAWIDSTKGFWNGGYDYWRWATWMEENSFQIERVVRSEGLKRMLEHYLWLYENLHGLQLFLCIGVYAWLIGFSALMGLVRKNRASVFVTIPALAILATLLIATPVFSEFRYGYAAICCVPFLLCAPFYKGVNAHEPSCSPDPLLQ